VSVERETARRRYLTPGPCGTKVTPVVRVFVLGSGSSGNGLLIDAHGSRVLIDAGIGPKVAARTMRALGCDLFPRGVDGVVLTHHHGDHFAHAEPLARALRVPLYMHPGISAARVRARWDVRAYYPGVPFRVGTFELTALAIPHDAPQVALAITSGEGARFGVATDLGHVPPTLSPFLGACDAALLEANYCPEMLAVGPYPEHLRRRIRGGLGHLANEQVADLAGELGACRLGKLYLGHISRSNNSPERALAVVKPRCKDFEVEAVPHGSCRVIEVVRRDGWERRRRMGEQLALAFG
jgi:phosphoribosyl 1,2-cyclic phosphodiesterase